MALMKLHLVELLYAIQKLPNKQCEHDQIPTWLLKKIATIVSPFIFFFNLSFATGRVPCQFEHAYFTPLLKKSDLNQETLRIYCIRTGSIYRYKCRSGLKDLISCLPP